MQAASGSAGSEGTVGVTWQAAVVQDTV